MMGYFSHSSCLLAQHRYKPHELSTTITALAHLKVQPPHAWRARFLAAAAAPPTMAAASQQALANLLWALSVLCICPGVELMQQW